MKLNLGCGFRRLEGFMNVDRFPDCRPDVIHDLESVPWPWDADTVDEVVMSHVLEHLGADRDVFFGVLRELYRVCRHDARLTVTVPYPRHDDFLIDPTHVRPIMPEFFQMLSKANCREWQVRGAADTPLALHIGVDFEIERTQLVLDPYWRGQRGRISKEDLVFAIKHYANVVKEATVVLRAVKAAAPLSR